MSESILKNLNNTISSSIYDFKQGIFEEEQQINTQNPDGSKTKVNYRVYSNYEFNI